VTPNEQDRARARVVVVTMLARSPSPSFKEATEDIAREFAADRERIAALERELAEARRAGKDIAEHLALADQIVNEAINEAAGAIAGIPDGKPGDRVVAVVAKLARAEAAEAHAAVLRRPR
jgi:hypothetical protein